MQQERSGWIKKVDQFFFKEVEITRHEYEAQKQRRRRALKLGALSLAGMAALLLVALAVDKLVVPAVKYNKALSMKEAKNYDAAITLFDQLGDYRDAAWEARSLRTSAQTYREALACWEQGDYAQAMALFQNLGVYADSAQRRADVASRYQTADELMQEGDLTGAQALYGGLYNYEDSAQRLEQINALLVYEEADAYYEKGDFERAVDAYAAISQRKDLSEKASLGMAKSYYAWAVQRFEAEDYEQCLTLVNRLAALQAYLPADNSEAAMRETCYEKLYEKLEALSREGEYAAAVAFADAYLPTEYQDTSKYIEYCLLMQDLLRFEYVASAEIDRIRALRGFLDTDALYDKYCRWLPKYAGEWVQVAGMNLVKLYVTDTGLVSYASYYLGSNYSLEGAMERFSQLSKEERNKNPDTAGVLVMEYATGNIYMRHDGGWRNDVEYLTRVHLSDFLTFEQKSMLLDSGQETGAALSSTLYFPFQKH